VLISSGSIVADGTGSEIKALAAGRTVRATVTVPDTAALTRLGGVDLVEVRGEQLYVHTTDSDRVARYLLTQTDARDLEITTHGLEDAFLSLTGRAPADANADADLEGVLR
jgi:ABC-2 type transport system ATP-binding protein